MGLKVQTRTVRTKSGTTRWPDASPTSGAPLPTVRAHGTDHTRWSRASLAAAARARCSVAR